MLHHTLSDQFGIVVGTEDGSTEALLQMLYGQYLILGVFVCLRPKNQGFL